MAVGVRECRKEELVMGEGEDMCSVEQCEEVK